MVFNKMIVLSLVVLLIIFGYIVISSLNIQTSIIKPSASPSIDTETAEKLTSLNNITVARVVSILVPAVDNEGNGVATKLTVEVIPGRGRVLTNINNLLFWVDTQQSIQVAETVAKRITGVDMSNIDLVYTIETEATIIEGPSAGAALTVATIAALEGKSLNDSVMITGTINPDGIIGPVGGIVAKAKASKDIGAIMFLVPEGQGVQTTYTPKQSCRQVGSFTFCVTEYVKQTVDTTKELGIQVIEVSNVEEALKYFLI